MSGRAKLLLAVFCLLLSAGMVDLVLAQGSPFGVGRPPAAAPPPPAADGIVGWLFAKQAEFYRQFSGLIRAAKADGTAVWTLLGVAFLYGVFHAAGPGHGKAVISSYLVANDETWRRGLVLAFASAFLQALVAVALVGIAAALLGATRKVMDSAVWWIEVISYGLIVLIGARLIWVKGRGFFAALRATRQPVPLGAAVTASTHAHDHHAHAHHAHAHHDHAPGEACDDHCGHAHAPEPQMLAGPGGWQRGLSAVFAVGLRPCSGAILVLVFALAQGLFWAGVAATFMMGFGTALTVAAIATLAVGAKGLAARFASTRPGVGSVAIRGIELAAAVLVFAFGVLLLAGYMASERMSV